jgi:hypothetical protein
MDEEGRKFDLPPYAFVPGGPWPHPTSSPHGHSFGWQEPRPQPISTIGWQESEQYLRGVALFEAGYYWEAHEAWEALWHAEGRRGPTADVLKGLIKLAAAGLKVRQAQRHGIITHATRAAAAFRTGSATAGSSQLGLDLAELERQALAIAAHPPVDAKPRCQTGSRVFVFRLEPTAP